MSRHHIGAALAAAAAVALIAPAAPAAAATTQHHHQHSHATSGDCTVPSAPQYARTPRGKGPWQVPTDPCNTEQSSGVYDNCAYWAAEKRPDVWTNAVSKYGYNVGLGGGWNVEIDARKAGYSITHQPQRGDLATWRPDASMGREFYDHHNKWWNWRASDGGHVAYVQKTEGNRIKISTMGWDPELDGNYQGGYTLWLNYKPKHTYFIHHL